jgi:uncharacterized protein (TIGR00369 family)
VAFDLQAMSDSVPFHRALALKVERTEAGVKFTARVGPEYVLDPATGVVHGGIVGSLLDIAATFALVAKTNHDWVTVDLRIDYLRPTTCGNLTITGEPLRVGRTIGRARAELRDATDAICALGLGTFVPVIVEDDGSA